MKALLLLLTGIILTMQAFAQTQPTAYSAVAFVQYRQSSTDSSYTVIKKHKWHSAATRAGTNIMICGGGLVAAGTALILIGKSQRKPYEPIQAYESFGATSILTGVPMAVVGAIIFGIGKMRDANHKNSVSIYGNTNEVGLVHNFR